MFYRDERLALFIDGANLYAAARALGFDIDYKLLRTEFMRRGKLVRAFYYTALLDTDDYSPVRPLVDWLNYNGFAMVTKPAKEFTDSAGRRKVKANMDIELAVDAMEMAPHVDHIVLFSGDGDFKRLVESLQRQGVRVSIVSTIRSSPPMIADELRRQCDNFIELDELREVIGRPPRGEQQSPCASRSAWRPTPTTNEPAAGGALLSVFGPTGARLRRGQPEAPPDCPLCPRLVAYRAEPAAHPDWYNGAVPSFGDPAARRPGPRPRAGRGRREPHRPAVHRRLRRHPALRDAERSSASPTAPSRRGPTTGCAHRRHGLQRRALRAPQNKPLPAEIADLPRLPRRAPRRAAPAARRGLPRPHRPRDAAAHLRRPPRRASLRHGARHDVGGLASSTATTARATTPTPAG
jgi:uncharacterized LabA/DUF88 family protein